MMEQGSLDVLEEQKTESLNETVRAGLSILARIIAKEEIKRQVAEGERVDSSLGSVRSTPVKRRMGLEVRTIAPAQKECAS